ncbi:MAG: zf-HC2 domain-containing protein [Gemmatimonadota bacterium]|jgi:anti-sigma factor (TIGR02949 family)
MKTPDNKHDHREDIGCLKAIELFYAYIDGQLDDPESIADFEYHLEHCRSCYSRRDFEGLLMGRLRSAAAERAPDGLRDRLRILMDNF